MSKRNFLLGKGERLTEAVKVGSGPVIKEAPYTFEEAKARLHPMLADVSDKIDMLPANACPDDLAIATLTLNPEYIAKTYFPKELLSAVGLETVGSRSRLIKPEKKSKDREPSLTPTTELFVLGKRRSFKRWAEIIASYNESDPGALQLASIEQIGFQEPIDKMKIKTNADAGVYEVVLHLDEASAEEHYLAEFIAYLAKRNISPNLTRRFYAGGLCFLETKASTREVEYIAQFSLVRVVRSMPSLRLLKPTISTGGVESLLKDKLPVSPPLDSKIKVAIFDGGIPQKHPLLKWVSIFEAKGVGDAVPELLEHGVGVTSACLFGHIDPRNNIPQPYTYIDHYRVLDNVPGSNPFELFEILDRIIDVLKSDQYQFVNLSLGPRLPVDDDEVHVWTAVLDEYLAKNLTLATIAVGNDGNGDPSIKANRVQVPADCVNALGIGACDLPDENWIRAEYSSIGPGRSPGLVKPDLVEFGGCVARPFLTVSTDGKVLTPTGGTSFAAPSVLRLATGVAAHFGRAMSPLAIRTLLVHCCETKDLPKEEIGFGRVSRSLDDLVLCKEGVVRVVFQGRITASKYLRAPIPIPVSSLNGKVKIKATLCYSTAVDPHHPENYTRSGLEVTFRPHKNKKRIDKESKKESEHAITKPFFGSLQGAFSSEEELRRDAMKWENCMHSEITMFGKSLEDPIFDIHYNARAEGHNDLRVQEIEYALVISIEAPRDADLYDRVVRRYSTQLEQLVPVIDLPIQISQ